MSLPTVRPEELDQPALAWWETHRLPGRGSAYLDWPARIRLYREGPTGQLEIVGGDTPIVQVPLPEGCSIREALDLLQAAGGPGLGQCPCETCGIHATAAEQGTWISRVSKCPGWQAHYHCCTYGHHWALSRGLVAPTAYEIEAAAEGLLEVELPPQPAPPSAPPGDHSPVTTPSPAPAAAPPVARGQLSLLEGLR